MVPELLVTDFDASLAFWRDILGFAVAYARLAERFAYLERSEGATNLIAERIDAIELGPVPPSRDFR